MNKVHLILCVIFSLLTVNTVLADVPSPPPGEEIRIELSQTGQTDYQFYLCSYDLEVKPNPNPPHPSRPNMIVKVPDSFQLKKIELSGKPYSERLGNSRIQYRGSIYGKSLYLAAIEKSRAAELEPKIKEAIDNNKEDGAIRFVQLETEFPSQGDESKGAKVIVNKISLNPKEMTLTVEEGTPTNGISRTGTCIGLGLLVTGIVLMIGWWNRKKFA